MVKLSAFADEISYDFNKQVSTLRNLGLNFIEPRIVWGKEVIDLSNNGQNEAKKILAGEGVRVSSIASPIGKAFVNEPFDKQKDRMKKAADTAHFFNTNYIRVFTFYLPENTKRIEWRSRVIEGLQVFLEVAYEEDVILLNENEHNVYCNTAARCKDIHDTIPSSRFRLNFDPGNFVISEQDPIADCWNILHNLIEYCHIKDAVHESGKIVPSGQGDGRIPEMVSKLKKKNYDGFYSIEPHLAGSRDDEEQRLHCFKQALEAFQAVLKKEEIEWE